VFSSATPTAAHEPDHATSLSFRLARPSLASLILYSLWSVDPIPPAPARFNESVIHVSATARTYLLTED
jgi:hypothetical protein